MAIDPEWLSSKQLYQFAWSRSSLLSYRQNKQRTAKKKKLSALALALLTFREHVNQIFEEEATPSTPLPRLEKPQERPFESFLPPRYFSRGEIELDSRKNPTPILYLLTESRESALPRPVPGPSPLLRSLCKGKGTLRKTKQGLVYLDIDNHFISSLIPYLQHYGLEKPPYFHLFLAPEGAHIPVIPAREMAFHYLEQIAEVDREFTFEIEGLYSLEPTIWPEMEQVWFFKVHSPALEALRRRYFLPPLPAGHAFHIAVAVKPRMTTRSFIQAPLTFRINAPLLQTA